MTTSFSASTTLGALLRKHRLVAGLTQEALAERAGLSPRGVQLLERGLRTAPRAETLRLLADALELDDVARAALVTAMQSERLAAPAAPTPALRPVLPPIPPTSLVGRQHEITVARSLLRGGDQSGPSRLLTLVGPGGVGKTRLALAIAADLATDFPGGVAWVELAPLGDPALVPGAIASAFGIRDDSVSAILEELRHTHLPVLLALDNCEHVLPAMPLVAQLLATSPRLTVLATSRSRLRLRGEREFPVEPLALPGSRAASNVSLAEIAGVDSVRLFVARAVDVRPDFALTPENAAAVAAICRQVDGLPLALELAAARVNLLPPAALRSRLQGSLALLTGGARDLPLRHQTLRDTIAWSYGLLIPAEQALFRHLSVFTGGWSIEAMEAFGDLGACASLADQSLLRPLAANGDHPRWTMLETVREYALECLAASGDEHAARTTHATFFLSLAERAEPELTGPDQVVWLDRLETEHDNLRGALSWAVAHDPGTALRFVAALWRFWYVRGYLREGRNRAEAALAQAGGTLAQRAAAFHTAGDLAQEQGDYHQAVALLNAGHTAAMQAGDAAIAARCLSGLGFIARNQGDYEAAEGLHQEALALQRELGDQRAIACTLGNLGSLAQNQGAEAQAEHLLTEALVTFRALGDQPLAADIMANLAILANQQGEHARAARLAEEALATYRPLGDRQGAATVLVALANAVRGEGDLLEAKALYDEALDLFRDVHHQPGIVSVLTHLATLALDAGDALQASQFLSESLHILQQTRDQRATATTLAACARAMAAQEQWEQAGRLSGAASTLCPVAGPSLPVQDASVQHLTALATAAIGEATWASARAAGQSLSLDRAIAEALANT